MATFINQSLEAASITKDIFIFDDADSYFVRATVGDISQNKITFGNGHLSDTVKAAGDISKNTITFGNELPGSGFVFAGGDISQNTITFGNGDFNSVSAAGDISNNTITFGNTFSGSRVSALNLSQNTITIGNSNDSIVGVVGDISHNTITFGNNLLNELHFGGSSSYNTITFGHGTADSLQGGDSSYNTITFNGGQPIVSLRSSSHDTITFRDTNNHVLVQGSIDHDTIVLTNGNGSTVFVNGGSDHDTIIVGNGDRAQITLAADGTAIGGDTIITGIGSSNLVSVAPHTSADTFGFSLGTDGISFTTINGGQAGDHVAVGNSAGIVLTDANGLGSTLAQASTTATDLASYISSLGALMNGDTYLGFNQTAQKTFIVTETQSGQMGAVELVGHAFDHNSIAGHVLTLA